MAESLLMASMAVGGGFAKKVVAMTSSHFASSERQYRFPLGYGGQRTPTAQWTVTGSGAALVTTEPGPIAIESATIGTVRDLGITDANNMGAAMAPAAYQSLSAFFRETNTRPQDYDRIFTGDLGELGHSIVLDFFARDGIDLSANYQDCGMLLYDNSQDVHAGASGCGCSAAVLCGRLLPDLAAGKLKKVLFCGTGAMMSPTSANQGESIPGICHLVCLEGGL